MSEYVPTLCTMCMHGINVKKMWECRGCGKRLCPHLVSRTKIEADGKKTAVCLTCLSTNGVKGVL